MKGLLLFFMLFGLGVTLGNDGDGTMTVDDLPSAFESSEMVQEPAVSEPAVSEPEEEPAEEPIEEPVIEIKEGGTYKVDITASDILWEGSKQPLYVENWKLYSLARDNANGKNKFSLYAKDLKTKEEKTVLEIALDYDDPNVYYIHSANAGGYIAMASNWDGESFAYYFMSFDDNGNLLKKKSVKEIHKMPEGSYFIGLPTSDGIYIYASFQDGGYGGVLMFDTEFNFLKQIADSPNAYTCIGKDGYAYLLDGFKGKLSAYNPDNNEFSEAIDLPDYSYCLFTGMDGELLFGDSSIYSYNYRTGNMARILSFEDYGIDCDLLCDIKIMYRDINGDIVVIYESFKDDNYTSVEAYEARFTLE